MMHRNRIIAGVSLGIVILLVLGYGLFLVSKSRSFQFFGGLTKRVETDRKVVALTFDDAPTPHVNDVLQILREKKAQATFYMIGSAMEKYPAEAKAIADAGMELGNHSYSHQRFLLKSLSFINTEIERTNSLIRNMGYTGRITFRPPFGKKLFALPWYLRQQGIQSVMCDVEPDTYAKGVKEGGEKTNFLVTYALEHTKPGSIILLHPFCDSCGNDRAAIGPIIDGLREKGYSFVTASQLLEYK